jgi:SPP1 gp7 family putative phage head morphogenesis protein
MTKNHVESEFDDLITAAYEEAYEPYIEALASTIEGKPNNKAWHEFQIVLAKAILLSQLLGLSTVTEDAEILGADFDYETDPKDTFAKEPPLAVWHGEIEARPFDEAIKLFVTRVPMAKQNSGKLVQIAEEVAAELTHAEKMGVIARLDPQTNALTQALSRQFWVSDVAPSTVVNLRNLLADSMRGVSVDKPVGLPDFIEEALKVTDELPAHRLETIFRTNLNSAFNEAHAAAYRSEDVKTVAPLIMLEELDDDRARPHHTAMDGYMNTVEYFDTHMLHPPNGYNCRGGTRIVSWTELEDMGFVNGEEELDWNAINKRNKPMQALIDNGVYPDPDFIRR